MDRSPLAIPLQDENARALRILGIILDELRIWYSSQHLVHDDTILGQLIIPVLRDPHLLPGDQLSLYTLIRSA